MICGFSGSGARLSEGWQPIAAFEHGSFPGIAALKSASLLNSAPEYDSALPEQTASAITLGGTQGGVREGFHLLMCIFASANEIQINSKATSNAGP